MLRDVVSGSEGGAPQIADRRLARRFADYWARSKTGRFPSWVEMRQAPLGDDWDWAFVADVEKSIAVPYFEYMGAPLSALIDSQLCGDTDWIMSFLERASIDIFESIATENTHARDDSLSLVDGRQILLRSIVAPLADDGERVTHVMGVVNGRVADKGRIVAV